MRHLVDITDITIDEIEELIALAEDIIEHPDVYAHLCRRKNSPPSFLNRARARV